MKVLAIMLSMTLVSQLAAAAQGPNACSLIGIMGPEQSLGALIDESMPRFESISDRVDSIVELPIEGYSHERERAIESLIQETGRIEAVLKAIHSGRSAHSGLMELRDENQRIRKKLRDLRDNRKAAPPGLFPANFVSEVQRYLKNYDETVRNHFARINQRNIEDALQALDRESEIRNAYITGADRVEAKDILDQTFENGIQNPFEVFGPSKPYDQVAIAFERWGVVDVYRDGIKDLGFNRSLLAGEYVTISNERRSGPYVAASASQDDVNSGSIISAEFSKDLSSFEIEIITDSGAIRKYSSNRNTLLNVGIERRRAYNHNTQYGMYGVFVRRVKMHNGKRYYSKVLQGFTRDQKPGGFYLTRFEKSTVYVPVVVDKNEWIDVWSRDASDLYK